MIFYILWNPASDKPPRVQFTSKKEAERVAAEMTERHGGTFYVMRTVSFRSGPKKRASWATAVVNGWDLTTPGVDTRAPRPPRSTSSAPRQSQTPRW